MGKGHRPAPSTEELAAFAESRRVLPGRRPDLGAVDPAGTPGYDGNKASAKRELKQLRDELFTFQTTMWAERKHSMLIVLQAMDAGGKDGTIRKVFSAFSLQGARVTGFGVPTEEELAHDFLWRIHPHAPGHGRVAIFNRSHYEDVLVVRVANLAPESVWRPRYDLINDWEHSLAAAGTTVLKFMLHVSRDEQRKRLQKRIDEPEKQWKFSAGDLDVRTQWDDYMDAYADALGNCSTDEAPWYLIPADHKWYRNLAVARIVASAARRMDPQLPALEPDLVGTKVPA
ncbi:MAG TPA: PPK2 family polyphosphate kinase [Candidatus Limnocylindria bacterium]|nr:PPK2 family polyphosphate kinase [Candidatus Limnocylindria bacterium]